MSGAWIGHILLLCEFLTVKEIHYYLIREHSLYVNRHTIWRHLREWGEIHPELCETEWRRIGKTKARAYRINPNQQCKEKTKAECMIPKEGKQMNLF